MGKFKSRLIDVMAKELGHRRAKGIMRICFLIGSWLVLWLTQGDVLYQMQDQSLWIFASPAEFETILIPADILTYISRFFLTLFAIPWLGTLITALLLTLTEILADAALRPKPSAAAVSYIPSMAMIVALYAPDYRIYCDYENSNYIKVILLIFAVTALAALVRQAFSGNRRGKPETSSVKRLAINIGIIAAAFLCAGLYGARDSNFKTLATLKHLADECKWNRMARIAEKVENPTRPVAAYHAIAITQMGQIGERLFRIHHGYEYTSHNDWEEKIENGGYTFLPDLTFYIGLTQPGYHYSMEQMVICGHYKHYLKLMVKASVINGDHDVTEKLLSILDKTPFEGKFVKRMRKLNEDLELVLSDKELAPIAELIPEFDTFEQVLGMPVFLTFYNNRSGGTDRAFDLSLAACLYKKSIKGFASKCGALKGRKIIPRYFQEAIVMICQLGNPDALQEFNISHDIFNSVTEFYNEIDRRRNEPDKGKAAMREKYGHTYMYYNTFENTPEDKK